jgi:hypothetical protein
MPKILTTTSTIYQLVSVSVQAAGVEGNLFSTLLTKAYASANFLDFVEKSGAGILEPSDWRGWGS